MKHTDYHIPNRRGNSIFWQGVLHMTTATGNSIQGTLHRLTLRLTLFSVFGIQLILNIRVLVVCLIIHNMAEQDQVG